MKKVSKQGQTPRTTRPAARQRAATREFEFTPTPVTQAYIDAAKRAGIPPKKFIEDCLLLSFAKKNSMR